MSDPRSLMTNAMQSVQTYDAQIYSCLSLLPKSSRPQMFAIWSFISELDSIQNRVSDSDRGRIRFFWWLDQIDAMYGKGDAKIVADNQPTGLVSFSSDFLVCGLT